MATNEESFEREFCFCWLQPDPIYPISKLCLREQNGFRSHEGFSKATSEAQPCKNDDQQVARYINGLNDVIQDRLMMQQIWSIDQAQALSLRAERFVRKIKTTKTPYPHIKGSSRSHTNRVGEKTASPKTKRPTPKQTRGKGKENEGPKCYKYGEEIYISIGCPLSKLLTQLSMTMKIMRKNMNAIA